MVFNNVTKCLFVLNLTEHEISTAQLKNKGLLVLKLSDVVFHHVAQKVEKSLMVWTLCAEGTIYPANKC